MARSRAYVFTINNWTEEDIEAVSLCKAQYTVYGKEVGENGTPHLQGYMYFKSARTLKSISKKLPRAYLAVRKGSHVQAREYCQKDGDYVELGTEPEQNGGNNMALKAARNKRLRDTPLNELVENGEIDITQVRKLKNARLDLAQEHDVFTAEGVRGVWYWGPPGS